MGVIYVFASWLEKIILAMVNFGLRAENSNLI